MYTKSDSKVVLKYFRPGIQFLNFVLEAPDTKKFRLDCLVHKLIGSGVEAAGEEDNNAELQPGNRIHRLRYVQQVRKKSE